MIINVYMPVLGNIGGCKEIMARIVETLNSYPNCEHIVVGDFNTKIKGFLCEVDNLQGK